MARKKTHEEFVKEVYELEGNEYSVIGQYINAKTKIEIKHNTCDEKYMVMPYNFLTGYRCPTCAIKRNTAKLTRTHDEFERMVFDAEGKTYTVLSEYKNSNTNIKMKHNTCGHEYEVRPSHFLNGVRCPKCSARESISKRTITHEEYVKKIYDVFKDEYSVIGRYVNSCTKIKVKHNTCGFEYEVDANSFKRGSSCRKCNGTMLKTPEEFNEFLSDTVGNEYEVLEPYQRARKKMKFKHMTCGNEFMMTPNKFISGQRCPKCKESKGERAVKEWLDENGISYEREYWFTDCRYKYPLPFDFAIIDNNSLIALIEYDGEQHYMSKEIWGGDKALENQKTKDKIKTDYCEANNIPLIRIPYWYKDNIDFILEVNLAQAKSHS